MQDAVYHQYAQVMRDHWWTDHRRKFMARWLRELGVVEGSNHPVLEIGCGAGTEHDFLRRYGPVTGIERNAIGLRYCEQRGYAELIAADLNTVELPSERFDLAVDFHVLYHQWVQDPGALLDRIRGALRPGGRLLLTEPAYMMLQRGHDKAVMAARRWNRRDLVELITSHGFRVERCSGFLTLLAPVVLLSLLRDRLQGPAPHAEDVNELHPPHPLVDRVLRMIMTIERALMRVHSLPTGTCWALVARRD